MYDAFAGAAEMLVGTDFIDPCPIGTIAREVASTHAPLREVAAGVMANWVDMLAAIFLEAGINADRADALATISIASIEGGFILARTHRSTSAWLAIGEFLSAAIADALPDGS